MKKLLFFFCCLTIGGAAQDISMQDLVNRKQFAAVAERAKNFTAADSSDFSTMYVMGQAYEGLLKYREAYGYYQSCLDMDTTNVDVLNSLARTAINLGRANEAEQFYYRVLATGTTDFYANYQLARLYQQLGDYENAIDKYLALCEGDEDNPTLHRNIGDCYNRLEMFPFAVLHYDIGYRANKENAGLASSLINTLLRTGDKENLNNALAVCDTALYYNPGNRQLLRNKGMALYMNKKYAEADTLYSHLLAEGDSTYLTIKFGGVSRYYAGQYMNSIELLEMAYQVDTTQVDVNILLGSALGKTYDRKRAFVHFDLAEDGLKPNEFLVNQLLQFRAETTWKDFRHKEASALYYQLWKKKPERLDFLNWAVQGYRVSNISQYANPNERQRGIYLEVLYLQEYLKSEQETKYMYMLKDFLQSLYEDMFFRSVTEEPMLSPEGRKSMLSIIDLRWMIQQLPDMPEEVRKAIEDSRKQREQIQKEKEAEEKKAKGS